MFTPYVLLSITNLLMNANVLFNLYVVKIPSSSLQRSSHMEDASVFNGILSFANDRNPSQSSLITRPIYWFITLEIPWIDLVSDTS